MFAKRSQREYILYHNNLRFVLIDCDVVNIRAFWSLELCINCTVDISSFDNFLSRIYVMYHHKAFQSNVGGGARGGGGG